ncbi:hypothetical protein L916_18722 [Plasmopara halstedii]|uniref:R3H domain-containing protein n=1 Tax=Plasmopara halstedii TaxID=4781 RepID=A0A0P1ADC5_PLAHL|nr:hypothetical protein L916_18722 [Plasmopara halstedii]CEG38342.1 hypothetical protein L916_18722 [Plasmopara halstedii]|eukprot:XP_024574711.1 hypothetical protein L916_18722 [Plasmopara halstedii]
MVEHVIKLSEAVDVSDSEVSSLCSSEIELEMAWGEGPIAPLRTEVSLGDSPTKKSLTAGMARSDSNGNGSSRARTPQKRSSNSPLERSKRLINIHPICSPSYLIKPNILPLGVRKQQRWFNDHHFGNRAASTRLEDLLEHLDINVEWKSNFKKLAEPQNESLQKKFLNGGGAYESIQSHAPWNRRYDEWNDAEQMFTRVDRRARTLMLRSFNSFAPFIEAVEYVVLHFIQWREVPSELEVAAPLTRMLKHPIELIQASENDVRLILPLLDSAFHRLIVHSVCQFYGVRSRTESTCRLNTKIMILKSPRKFCPVTNVCSLCEFIRETRIARRHVGAVSVKKSVDKNHMLELQSISSECSEGFLMVDAPRM